jgi:uncharacterized protein
MDFAAALGDVSALELILIGIVAFIASLVGGIAGYGTGILMPLVLVPIAGAEAVVPIIGITALFTNSSRVIAFRGAVDWQRWTTIVAFAAPFAALGAYGFTLLSGRGAALVIGATLIASVPLRKMLRNRGFVLQRLGLALSAPGFGLLAGGTTGSGVVLISLLMASGLTGASVIATDAAISILIGAVKVSVLGLAGAVDARVLAFALLIGVVTLPGAFAARMIVERMPVRLHTAILDAVVILGGSVMVYGALR